MNVHNLKPFQKGVSGNPAGRPPKLPAIDELLAKVLSDEVDGVTIAEEILKTVAKQAIAGNLHAAEMILNRAYGKPKQATQQDDRDVINFNGSYCGIVADDELLAIIQHGEQDF
jgi:hypothetical protein